MTFTEFIDMLRGVGFAGIVTRLVLAVICGGIIGLERETKRRAAGFRTHTLICIGASLTTLISSYLVAIGMPTDPARLGAQVISGMSFIGAGAIIVTSRRQVKGLTTAAGLWTAAIIGLGIGVGYYEAAILAVVLVLVAEVLLAKLEYFIVTTARTMNVLVEFHNPEQINDIVDALAKNNIVVTEIEYTKSKSESSSIPTAILSLRFHKKTVHTNVLSMLGDVEGVINVEEL